jgi:UDPglucose 6-dehydrogenase
MRIGVIGRGTVGGAVYDGLKNLGHNMSFHDPRYPDSRMSNVLYTDIVFLCVPTDRTPEGNCDVSIVESVCDELAVLDYQGLICIKSTVIPGTTDRMIRKYPNLSICCAPEFLRARTALEDFTDNHDVLVIGSYQQEHFDLIKQSHGHYPQSVICVEPSAAEMTKYFHNVHNALEVTFANVIYSMCEHLGVDYQQVYAAITKRSNINGTYLRAGGEWRGFGGHCLPKDTQALENLQRHLGLNYQLIGAILADNERFTK